MEAPGNPVSDQQFVDLELNGRSLDDFMQDFQYAVEMLRATGQGDSTSSNVQFSSALSLYI